MFNFCQGMKTLILKEHFITDKTAKIESMFYCCSSLEAVDLSGADTSNATDLSFMFYHCRNLKSLDLTSFDTSKVTISRQMFNECENLKTVLVGDKWDIGSLDGSAYSKDMFNDCKSIVGGNGTVYNSAETDAGYAHIDKDGQPGYLTRKEAAFKTNSMTLGGSISLNFYVALTAVPEDRLDDTYVVFTVNGKKQTAKLDRNKMNSKKTAYGFTCKLNSVSMADDVKAVLTYYTADGRSHTVSKASTAETYLKKFNENDEAVTWNLIKGINDYGYYMQKYLSKHSASPWTLGTDHKAMSKAFTAHSAYNSRKNTYLSELSGLKKSFGTNGSIDKVSYSLSLDADTSLNFKIKKKKGYTGSVKVMIDGKEVAPKNLTDGRLQITVGNIPAHQLDEVHTVTVTTSSGTATYKACALSYVYECINAPTDELEFDAACAMYEYYKATVAFKNK